jgi:hypothetical protein
MTYPSRIYTPNNSITKPSWVFASTVPRRFRPISPKAAQSSNSGTCRATDRATLGGIISPPCVQKVCAETESPISRARSCNACRFLPSYPVSSNTSYEGTKLTRPKITASSGLSRSNLAIRSAAAVKSKKGDPCRKSKSFSRINLIGVLGATSAKKTQ